MVSEGRTSSVPGRRPGAGATEAEAGKGLRRKCTEALMRELPKFGKDGHNLPGFFADRPAAPRPQPVERRDSEPWPTWTSFKAS